MCLKFYGTNFTQTLLVTSIRFYLPKLAILLLDLEGKK